ncbi:hypothetical protein M427DRAFT_183790 [Gonapodya prolifera JEL478]|uniref:Glyoxalase/Bleomycin resistance-like N-terminal domain-containing protein n=1 Tax=Gonapodya prolifera (strain JEL478) TaxID=1344416 RepID=A0A139A187_GONPJ|nr:hypothetical protein M427DRAFT_183790 [Gonapodya prolifera JEL478]|eukprot:KXS10295.1 hypothetical protein M427DRAFT_183790 [Gonapodya prolifera JEL478]
MIISRLNAWIPVADLARAKSFYEAVFGWRVFPLDPNYPQMLIWTPDAKDKNEGLLLPTGGFFETDAAKATGVRSGVKIYLLAENIEEKLKEIEKHGGKCLQGKQLVSFS